MRAAVVVAALLLAACQPHGERYVISGSEPPILLDTKTGKTWRLNSDAVGNVLWIPVRQPIGLESAAR